MTEQPRIHCVNGHTPPPENQASRFCTTCGARMVVTCPQGHEVKQAAYCSVCGVPLTPPKSGTVAAAAPGGNTVGSRPRGEFQTELPPASRNWHRRSPIAIWAMAAVGLLIGAGVVLGITQLINTDSDRTAGPVVTATASAPTAEDAPPSSPAGQSPSAPPAQSSVPAASPPPAEPGPADTVQKYFDAINTGDYERAWELGGKNLHGGPYSSFVESFEGTAFDSVTIVSTAGNEVHIELDALQEDGTHRYFSGKYSVRDGAIISADIQQN